MNSFLFLNTLNFFQIILTILKIPFSKKFFLQKMFFFFTLKWIHCFFWIHLIFFRLFSQFWKNRFQKNFFSKKCSFPHKNEFVASSEYIKFFSDYSHNFENVVVKKILSSLPLEYQFNNSTNFSVYYFWYFLTAIFFQYCQKKIGKIMWIRKKITD